MKWTNLNHYDPFVRLLVCAVIHKQNDSILGGDPFQENAAISVRWDTGLSPAQRF